MSRTAFIGLATTAALVAVATVPQVSTAQNVVAAVVSAAATGQRPDQDYRTCFMKRHVIFTPAGPAQKFDRICTR